MVQLRSEVGKNFGSLRPLTTVIPKPVRVPRTPLGTFSRFPFEIRREIWNYLLDEPVSLSVLRTNKHLHEEIAIEIYKDHIIEIDVDVDKGSRFEEGTFAGCDPKAGIVACTLYTDFQILQDADWARFPTAEIVARTPSYHPRILENADRAKFKLILIQIYTAAADDPGQILIVRNNVVNLVAKMQKAPRLRCVRVDILGGPEEWTDYYNTGNEFHKSDSIRNTRDDIEHVLKPFKLLRGVEFASAQPDRWDEPRDRIVYGPKSKNISDIYKLGHEIEQLMMRRSAFGEEESDAAILEEHQIMTIELDKSLDREGKAFSMNSDSRSKQLRRAPAFVSLSTGCIVAYGSAMRAMAISALQNLVMIESCTLDPRVSHTST
ncbi:hypothetical protein MMC18_005024 [Xylographa bjoerkii]|nr:hypothetical protein [Xylographa bjoerkii]